MKQATRWLEHFFIIPFRWFRLHYRAWKNQQQRCKVCGYRDKFDFHVDGETWYKIVPPKYQERVVCLACFDDFAKAKEINYEVQLLCFAGNKMSISFNADRHVEAGSRYGDWPSHLEPPTEEDIAFLAELNNRE